MWIVLIAGLTSLVAVSAAPFLDCRADVAFVLDGSASVGQQNWDLMLTFIRDFATLSTFGSDKTLIGVISFADEATVDIKLDDHKTSASFIGALRSVTYKDSGTNTAAALRVARTSLFNSSAGARDAAPNVLILVTDGQPTVDTEQTFPEVALTHEAGISIFVVGIGRDLSRKELVKLANNESDRVLMADDFQELIRMVNMVLSTACEIATSTVRPPTTVTTARIRADSTTTTGTQTPSVAPGSNTRLFTTAVNTAKSQTNSTNQSGERSVPTSSPGRNVTARPTIEGRTSSTISLVGRSSTKPVVETTTTSKPGQTPTPSLTPSASVTPNTVKTPTPAPTRSPSATPSPVGTPTPAPTRSPSATPSPVGTPTPAPAPSPSATPSPVGTPTPAPTRSPSATPSPVGTPTPRPTPSPSATPSPVGTPTPAPTRSPSATPSPVGTPTPAPTPSPSATPSPVGTPTPAPTPSPSATPSPVGTPTPAPTRSPSATPSPVGTPTPAPTRSPSATPSPVGTPTPAPTHSPSATPSPVGTPTPAPTRSPSATPSPVGTPTPAPTRSPSATPSPVGTPTPAPTRSPSATPSPVGTPTPAPTPSPSATPSPVGTPTPAPTPSPSTTPSPVGTPTPAPTPSPSATPSPVGTPTPAPTPSPSATPSRAGTPTPAPTPSPSATPSPVGTPTPAPTPSPSATPSPVGTPTPAPTRSPSATPSPVGTPTPAPTSTPVKTPSPTLVPTPTSSTTGTPLATREAPTATTTVASKLTTKSLIASSTVGFVQSSTKTKTRVDSIGTTSGEVKPTKFTLGMTTGSSSRGITPDSVATPTPSPVVSSTLTPESTPTTTPVVSPTPTPTPAVSPTPIPVVSPTPSPVVSPTPSPAVSPTPSPAVSPTPSPAVSPTPSPAVSPTPSPAVSPTPSPAVSPTPSPAVSPTPSPAVSPTPSPAVSSTPSPAVSPTPSPTQTPGPTAVPTPTTPGTNPESRIPCDKTDLVLLLDSSGSLNSQGNWNRIKEVASIIATSLWLDQVHTQVGVVVFSSEAFLTVQLGTVDDKTQLVSVIDSVPWTSQMTNISGALRLARTKMFNTNYDRKDAENVILLITDGRSNRGITTTITEAEKLKNQGVVIYVVGLGGQVNLKELRGVSSEPSSSFLIAVPKVEELTSNTEAIFKRTCLEPRSLIAQQPVAGSCPFDVVFVMHDVTGSNATFRDMIDIVRDLAYQVDLDTHRIGLVAQSGQDVIRFYPTEFVRRDDVLALLDTLNPIGPSTKPAETFVEGLSMLAQAKDTEEPALKIIMLLLPGGIDPSEIQSIEEQAQTAKDAGVIIYVFYAAMAREELVWVASRPSQMFLLPHILPQDTINVCMTHQPGTLGCDFEDANKQSTFCGMAQSTDDDFDWTIQSGSTASLHTGPDSDVTGAFYIYLEASAPRKLGDVAEIALPRVTWSGASCLSFFYHMMGWHVGQLQVVLQTRVAQEERIVWVLGGHQSEKWRLGMVTVTITDKDQLLLRGIRGGAFSGDISLDHIRLSTGACAASTASFVGLAIP